MGCNLLAVTLFFELYILTAFADLAILFHTFCMFFPALTLLVLLKETQSAQSVTRLLTEHCKYCALSSWHMGIGYGFFL